MGAPSLKWFPMFILVFLILAVLVAPAAIRVIGAVFIVWVCVTYWYIGIPLAILAAIGAAHTRTAKP